MAVGGEFGKETAAIDAAFTRMMCHVRSQALIQEALRQLALEDEVEAFVQFYGLGRTPK